MKHCKRLLIVIYSHALVTVTILLLKQVQIFQEIEFHKAEIKSVQVEVSKLETEVEKLVKSPKSNIRMMMFPEFYPDRPK